MKPDYPNPQQMQQQMVLPLPPWEQPKTIPMAGFDVPYDMALWVVLAAAVGAIASAALVVKLMAIIHRGKNARD